jgi:serine/threonine protein kinase
MTSAGDRTVPGLTRGADPALEIATGCVLTGGYRLTRRVHEGPNGVLFEATTTDARCVALKTIRREFVSEDGVSRFIREASVLAASDNPHIVNTIDIGHDLTRDLIFVVRPMLQGADLQVVLRRTGALDPAVATHIGLQACVGLGAAHANDVVNGNVKPSNIWLDTAATGEVVGRVCDFGIALRTPDLFSDDPAVVSDYAAPEQFTPGISVDRRADVYSLAVILYEMLTGVRPYSHIEALEERRSAMWADGMRPVQDLAPWVPPEIATAVQQALRGDRTLRFPSAEALAMQLRRVCDRTMRLTEEMLAPVSQEARKVTTPLAAAPAADATYDERADPLIGHRLGGRYEIRGVLGRGGMGVVYEALTRDGVPVAAKVISRDLVGQSSVTRFLREGKAATRIDDVHVCKTTELGVDLTLGAPFIVMELLHGGNLAVTYERASPMEPVPLARLFLQAARGLAAAHRQGIVHRDVKPANLFLHVPDPAQPVVVKIFDFGIAKGIASVREANHELTNTGEVMGSPRYMSPECATDPKKVDHRSDVWSLCASLYEGLTGQKPWVEHESLAEILVALCTKTMAPIRLLAPWVPADLAAVVDRGITTDVGARWQTMADVVGALERVCGGSERVLASELARVDDGRRATARRPASVAPASGSIGRAAWGSSSARRSGAAARGRWLMAGASLSALGILAALISRRGDAQPRDAAPVVPPAIVAAPPSPPPSVSAVPAPEPSTYTAMLAISPRSAKVFLDGAPQTAVDGNVAITGEVGQSFDVRLDLGRASRTTRVVITKTGDLEPARVELPVATTYTRPATGSPSAAEPAPPPPVPKEIKPVTTWQ